MGGMLLLGVTVWTVLLLSAVHVSSAGEALSAVDSLPCIGSGCGAETVEWSNVQQTAVVTGRKLLTTTKELDIINTEKSFADPSIYTTDVISGTTRHLLVAPPPPRVAPVGRTPWGVVNPPSPTKKTKKPVSPAVSPGAST
ncbi:hypothetical protein MPTK1_4g02180 [Marchantia polymorpha subsp. ruderalis]|uniref:Uncharacterized protein n=2 Tax=Marchantia polymorpha TaxID=3197 RepID=A0AAF6B5F6_MARPO|nr:hypothetical protein MARPO_0080s0080 [Marchantia polymorpha]BBN07240.1 hypothetical protein Mp_4g02180 [Marchantia polymorpha subsp. ruderalis]|eukprot:PTQ34465.1 hypothetical protein MARPO_0080s0080 [Marchantia polymorpha]